MKLKTLLTINAIVALVFGLIHLFAPERFWIFYGINLGQNGLFMARSVGAEVLGFAILTWFARSVETPKALRAIALACFTKWTLLLLVNLAAQLGGLVNSYGWSNEVLFLLFAGGYAYFLLKPVISESLFHQPIVTP